MIKTSLYSSYYIKPFYELNYLCQIIYKGAIVESLTSSNSNLENQLKHIQAAKAFYTSVQAVQMLMLPTFMNIVGKMLVLFLTAIFFN